MSKDNYDYAVKSLDEITRDYMYNLGLVVMKAGITSVAPLGFGGNTYFMFGKLIESNQSEDGDWHRVSQVSFRNYCNSLEMFITDKDGKTLIYNRMNCLNYNELIDEYYREFCLVKHLIEKNNIYTFDANNLDFANAEPTMGFDMLKKYFKTEAKK